MMMKRRWPVLGLACVLLLVSACTSDPDEATKDEGTAAPAQGINEATIKIGYIGADFGPLSKAGLAPDLGDQKKVVQAVVDQINEDGGIGGRKVEVRMTLVDATGSPDDAQAACIEMTQDFGAFAVVVGPAVTRDTVRCLAVTNRTLTFGPTGLDSQIYEEAEGRLFTMGTVTSMSTDRQYRGWAEAMETLDALDGATIGVVTDEQSPEFVNAAKDALIPALEEAGHTVAVNAVLPCPEGDIDCAQHETVVQQMKDAKVDVVFMAAANVAGPTFVKAADNLNFTPTWLANGNQVTDTVAQFFEAEKDAWDGAVGTSTVFAKIEDLTDGARRCNDIVTERGKETYEPGSDAFGFAASVCLNLQILPMAAEGLDVIDQATMIEAIEGMGEVEVNAGPPGSLSPTKHDAGDHLFLADYSADAGEFVDQDTEPIQVSG